MKATGNWSDYVTGATAKRVVYGALLISALYVVHAQLQFQHYKRCNANIFKVMLFHKSDMCIHLGYMLSAIEVVCSKDVVGLVGLATAGMRSVSSVVFAAS